MFGLSSLLLLIFSHQQRQKYLALFIRWIGPEEVNILKVSRNQYNFHQPVGACRRLQIRSWRRDLEEKILKKRSSASGRERTGESCYAKCVGKYNVDGKIRGNWIKLVWKTKVRDQLTTKCRGKYWHRRRIKGQRCLCLCEAVACRESVPLIICNN